MELSRIINCSFYLQNSSSSSSFSFIPSVIFIPALSLFLLSFFLSFSFYSCHFHSPLCRVIIFFCYHPLPFISSLSVISLSFLSFTILHHFPLILLHLFFIVLSSLIFPSPSPPRSIEG